MVIATHATYSVALLAYIHPGPFPTEVLCLISSHLDPDCFRPVSPLRLGAIESQIFNQDRPADLLFRMFMPWVYAH